MSLNQVELKNARLSTILIVVGALVTLSAHAVQPTGAACKYQDVRLVPSGIEQVPPAPDPSACSEFSFKIPIIGTLQGYLLTCVPNGQLESADENGFSLGYWLDAFVTPAGTINMKEYGAINFNNGMQNSIIKVVGGTGAFAGASGFLTSVPDWAGVKYDGSEGWVWTGGAHFTGYVCTTAK